ncbi:MAG: ABC transporter permease [Negativicutes bacterium]|jgi:ABC-2 type transport system permease protein
MKASFRRLRALLVKEFIQIARDRTTFIMLIGVPVMQVILFGFAVNTDVKHLPAAVFDQSLSADSRELLDSLTACEYFNIKFVEKSNQAVDDRILSGDAKVGIIIPPDFTENIKHARPAQVQVLVDASDSMTSSSAIAAAQLVGSVKSQQILMERQGVGRKQTESPIDMRIRPWFNPDFISAFYMVPGIVAVILTMTMVMVTAMAIVKEKEVGTLEQLLVTPLRPFELMLGKIIPYVVVGYAQTIIAISAGVLIFDLPFRGSILLLFALTTLYIIASLALGILISTISQTQIQASQMSLFVFLPSMMLSGYLFPRESMPTLFYYLGDLFPITYYLTVIRGIVLKGVGMSYLYPMFFALLVYGIVAFTISVIKFKNKLG